MRDFMAATRDRVVVFDGSMGATLEQFDLSLEDDYKLPGRCHEALVLNRPDVIEQLHASMIDAGAEVVETDTFQGSRIKLDEWGLGEHTLEINRKAAEIARKAVGEEHFVAGSIGPTGFLPASDDPTLGNIRFRELVKVFEEQGRGLLEGGVDHRRVELLDDVRPVEHERLVTAPGKLVVVLEREVELLERRAHAAVEDDDAVACGCHEITHQHGIVAQP